MLFLRKKYFCFWKNFVDFLYREFVPGSYWGSQIPCETCRNGS